ncbi:glutathione S-transferase [Jeongeupia naejangsanensis]|uniref:Glutathione S-transferase n=1 Tax=Jeongeupia naejangsanensis TaxID=613195 RepID=A0ABS2BNJ2_9NEIS|nr:glutathione S-transferase [Jeongeupia naejangsanensis]MBM3116633.1 glutathione S-transferase [Jeongeupia naejangsanensis]
MKLISSLTSPFGRKVRIVLAEKHIDYQLVEDSPHAADNQIAALNPLGKVPVLILDDGRPLYDSSVIVDYLDQISPVGKLIPAEHRQAIGVKRWEALADGITDAAILIVMESRRPAEQQSAEWVAKQQLKIERGLERVATDLADRKWCTGDAFTLADVAIGCMLGYLELRFPELQWAEHHPNLAGLRARLDARASFGDTRPPAV